MDKLSEKILAYISKGKNVDRKDITEKYGNPALVSLEFLYSEGYISATGEITISAGFHGPIKKGPNGIYNITSKGIAYLEEKPGKTYDRWSTRILAIWGAITGTAAIVLEIVLHFL